MHQECVVRKSRNLSWGGKTERVAGNWPTVQHAFTVKSNPLLTHARTDTFSFLKTRWYFYTGVCVCVSQQFLDAVCSFNATLVLLMMYLLWIFNYLSELQCEGLSGSQKEKAVSLKLKNACIHRRRLLIDKDNVTKIGVDETRSGLARQRWHRCRWQPKSHRWSM